MPNYTNYIFSQNIGTLYIKSVLDRKFESTFYNGRIYIYILTFH